MEDIKTLKVGDKHYDIDSATDLAGSIIRDIATIEEEIRKDQIRISIAQLARTKLMDELQKELPKMKEVNVTGLEKSNEIKES